MNKRSPSRPSSRSKNKGKTLGCVLLALLGILAVGTGVLSFIDVAGDLVAKLASDGVREQLGMALSIGGARGNPIRGYTLHDVSLASAPEGEEGGRRIFSAKTLGASINFPSLFRGSPRLSLLTVGGVDMDLDRLMEELGKIQLPESSGGGEIPIDRVGLQDSRFTSRWGSVEVTEVVAAIKGSLLDVSVDGTVNGVPVNGSLAVDVRADEIGIGQTELRVGKGLLTAGGRIGTGDQTFGLKGSVKGLDVSEITAFWPAFLSSRDYAGNADIDVSAEGSFADPVLSAALDFRGSKLGGYPLESLSSRLTYSGLRLTADDVKAASLGVPIGGQIALAMQPGSVPSVMVKLEGKNAPLSELAKLYPALGQVSGSVERFAANIQGPANALSGTVEISAPSVSLLGKRIENFAVQLKLAKSDTASLSGKLVLEGAQGYIQGSVEKILTGANLNLTAKLLGLDIRKMEDLIPDGKKYALAGALTANLAIKGRVASPSVSGTLSSPKFTASGYTLDKPSLTFTWEKDSFSLKESSGSWNGLPIKVSGTVGPLSSSTPAVNMTAQVAFNPAALKQFIPDVDAYKLQGTIQAGVKLSGRLPQPKIELAASSPALSAFGASGVSVKNLEVTTALAGDLTQLDKVDVALKAAVVSAAGVGLQNVSAAIRKDGAQVRLENVSAQSGAGSIAGSGTVDTGAAPRLNLAFDLRQLDLAPLAQSGGLGVALAGTLSGKVEVEGPASNPSISFSGQAPTLAVEGMTLTALSANISGNAKALKINEFKANVGGAPLSATGDLSLDPFRANIDVSGKELDLAALTAGIPDLAVTGKADFDFRMTSTAQGNSGTGTIRSAAVTANGIRASGVVLPLAFSGNTLKSEGGLLDFYGGRVTNSLTFDLGAMRFNDILQASGVDVNTLVQDASGGLGGKITGRAGLSMKVSGNAAKSLTYSGSGQLSIGEGAITGFSGLNLLTRLYGVEGIRYTKVTAPLKLETGKLYIGKGSSAVPPAGDPIYKSASLAEDGTLTFDKKLYFVADANLNFQLINALTGGVLGGAESLLKGGVQDIFSGKNLESALKGAVSAGRDKGASADFRNVTAKVTGTFDSPSASLVKVGPSATAAQEPAKQQPAATPSAPAVAPVTPAAPAAPAKPEEIIKEKIIDAILPPKESAPGETQNAQPQTSGEAVKQEVEKKIEDELRKGLNNLFKR